MRQELFNFHGTQLARMTLAVKQDELANPVDMTLGRFSASEPLQSALAELIEEPRRLPHLRRNRNREGGQEQPAGTLPIQPCARWRLYDQVDLEWFSVGGRDHFGATIP